MISKKEIIVPNYKLGVEIAVYLQQKNKSIYVNNVKLEYEQGKKFYSLIKEINDLNEVNCIPIEEENTQIELVNNIKELIEKAKRYKYIAVEEEFKTIFQQDFGYVEVSKYSETREGQRWIKIENLKQEKCDLEILKSLEIIKKNKEFNEEFCTYVNIDYSSKNQQEIYEYFFEELPLYVPEAMDGKFYEMIDVKVELKERMMIDKLLIKHIKEEVLYIGREAFIGAKNQIIYQPKFNGYPTFEFKKLDLKTNGYYEEKQAANGNIARIYANQLHLRSNEFNFYSNYKKYLKELLYKICVKKEQINFIDKFKIDKEFYKLLQKTYQILSNFEAFLIKNDIKTIKKGVFLNDIYWDFYNLEKNIVVDVVTSLSNMKQFFYKKKYCTATYYLINEEGFFIVPEPKHLDTSRNNQLTIEDDLFYWYSL